MITILEAMKDPNLFGPWFTGPSWNEWKAFLAALFGLHMGPNRAARFRRHTGRKTIPTKQAKEAWMVVGRRGGKSIIAALNAVYLACFRDYTPFLAPGEVATVMVLAADRKQARVIMRYAAGFFDNIPMLSAMVVRRTRESIELNNKVIIEIHTASYRSTRGYSIAAAILDECAFFRSEEGSANLDSEILAAIRPAGSTIPGSIIIVGSSPYSRRGILWDAHHKYYGKDDDRILVWQADTKSMNPSIDPEIIEQAYEEDEVAASAEYGAQFRRDIETFVSKESVEQSVIPGRIELPPASNIKYIAFVDPSGGSSDSMTCAVSHRHGDMLILDAIRECRPPFSPEAVVKEFSDFLKTFRISRVTGDRYGGEFPRELFRKHGIDYKTSELTKSDIYRELLAPLNSGRIELLDNSRLIAQLCGLERRTSRGGRDSIDHSPGGHDDVINSAAGALVAKAQKKKARIL
jgi:hypothetical protein